MTDAGNWNLPPPPGFRGLNEHLPLKIYEQLLPHWRQDGATYFVTYRLADSLPRNKLNELRAIKTELKLRHPASANNIIDDEIARKLFQQVEEWLDEGMGSCILKQPDVAQHIVKSMHDRDGHDYELGCYAVVANHIHAIVRPLAPTQMDVEAILRIWKGRSAYDINVHLGQSGTLWQRESYDRIIRDEEHLWNVIQYIGDNPAKAGLNSDNASVWISPSWIQRGWRFEKRRS